MVIPRRQLGENTGRRGARGNRLFTCAGHAFIGEIHSDGIEKIVQFNSEYRQRLL